ncbi:Undecaprenyl-phosphate galactose phosphotransferase [Thermobaculum terrenum ATCC BAA-798]|uniref:Undecaprenyl-phosphate galactose phosphotransferase n=1 Tax=Thermobaculum terrenum (strain ATCC BAA-798 / CCMEE 7001 / YNP1) TaxID=525904 RepID=D1CBC4_THET1|nr:sugar transferase [Thermobaculum terrenum]ACZ42089.1 Undecaprenyl-phosphate galactose phosphotransferase [Thermobaculum terrenum ATCC BAA-798]
MLERTSDKLVREEYTLPPIVIEIANLEGPRGLFGFIRHYGISNRYTTRVIYTTLFKPLLDRSVALVFLILLSPLLLLIGLAIYLDSGRPIILSQDRVGRGGSVIKIYKFRTMLQPEKWSDVGYDPDSMPHKMRDDPRVTKVGRILRKTSLDEIPQLLNVLKGDMSLVGPRPELPEIVERYQDWQHSRHLVKPGITGWWQVMGRSELPMHENTDLDIYYVLHQSLKLDVEILLRTILVVFSGKGAF